MSSRGALVAGLIAAAGVIVYLLIGRGDTPESLPETPVTSTSEAESPPGPATRHTREAVPSDETGVALRGRVQAQAEGTAVAGAVVTVTPAGEEDDDAEPRSVISDAEGRFELAELSPGRYAVSATAAGYLPAVQRSLDVQADASVTLTLTSGGHPLRGTVSDATGGSVDGALVRLTPLRGVAALGRLDGFGTLCGDDGAYSVHVAPGRYRVDVSHPDYATDTRTVEVGPGAQSQDFALVPMGVVEGVVRQQDGGAPVPGAWVSWQRERQRTIVPGYRTAMVEGSGRVRADEQGRFVLRGLSPGAIGLKARAAGAASEVATVVPLAMAEHVTDVVVLVVAAHDLRGRVVVEGDPEHGIAGARVTLVSEQRDSPRATTDEQGHFVLRGVLSGSHALVARASGWRQASPEAAVVGDEPPAQIVLELEKAPAIRGRVEPATVAEVSIELRAETMRMGMARGGSVMLSGGGTTTETDEEGRFELGPATPGPTTVVARVADGRAGEATVEVGPDGADEVVIRLEPRSTVRGEVRSEGGDMVAQATVSLRPTREAGAPDMRLTINGRDMGADMGTTTEDGRFEFVGLRDASYELTAEGGGGRQRVSTSARPGQDVTLELADLGTIEGQVTLDGQPLGSYSVRVEGPVSRSQHVRDGGGHFEIGRLDPGSYRVIISSPEGSGSAEVTLAAGDTARQDISLEHRVKVTGRIVDTEGAPVAGATIMIGDGTGGRVSITSHGDDEANTTDDDGRFEITCAAGPHALMALSPTSPQPLVVHFFEAQPGEDMDVGELKERAMGGQIRRGEPPAQPPPGGEP